MACLIKFAFTRDLNNFCFRTLTTILERLCMLCCICLTSKHLLNKQLNSYTNTKTRMLLDLHFNLKLTTAPWQRILAFYLGSCQHYLFCYDSDTVIIYSIVILSVPITVHYYFSVFFSLIIFHIQSLYPFITFPCLFLLV